MGSLETQVEEGGTAESSSIASERGNGRVASPETEASSAGSPGRTAYEQRRETYQSFALRQIERETRPQSMMQNGGMVQGGGGRRRMKKWLVLVVRLPCLFLPFATLLPLL
jgi:hypothetical protein